MFCLGVISTVFKCSLVKSLAVEFKHVAERVVTTVCFAAQTQYFKPSKIFLEQSRMSFNMIFVVSTTPSGKEIAASDCSKRIITVFTV